MVLITMTWYDTAQLSRIQDAKERKDWFTAIVLSATQIERHGYLVILEYLESFKINPRLIDTTFERIYLRQIAKYLQILEKIDKHEYKAIVRINTERNKFIHRKKEEEFKRGIEAEELYSKLVDEAIRILIEKLNCKRLYVRK